MTLPPCDPEDHVLAFQGNRKVDELYRGTLEDVWITTYKGFYRCSLCGFGRFGEAVLDDMQTFQ